MGDFPICSITGTNIAVANNQSTGGIPHLMDICENII